MDAARIARFDEFRRTFKGGRVCMTPSVYSLPVAVRARALWRTSVFEKFHPESEHDWGVFIFAGYSFLWRIEEREELELTLYLREDFLGAEFLLPTLADERLRRVRQ